MNPTERNEILEMLAEGKITAAEAIALLDGKSVKPAVESFNPDPIAALKADEPAIPPAGDDPSIEGFKMTAPKKPAGYESITITEDDLVTKGNDERPRWLKIRVRDLGTGRNKVSVTLPLGLVNFGLGIARRFGAEFDDEYRVDEIWHMVKEGQRGVLIDVEDEEDNEQVQIYLD